MTRSVLETLTLSGRAHLCSMLGGRAPKKTSANDAKPVLRTVGFSVVNGRDDCDQHPFFFFQHNFGFSIIKFQSSLIFLLYRIPIYFLMTAYDSK